MTPKQTVRNVESALINLGSTDPRVCSAAVTEINRLGRLKEPVLRQISRTTRNGGVKVRADELLKGFVAVKR